ncbi:hypothetical protein [Salinicoccus sp. YB14-2]|uniref:hypothetical protein n=1 Tax=Salinicoccus sp. YB14-2 TaxID=1572701 RepID=UPI000AA3A7C5|nr:hypothetical protein [Salinicoccus sp. YB14-2]
MSTHPPLFNIIYYIPVADGQTTIKKVWILRRCSDGWHLLLTAQQNKNRLLTWGSKSF